MTRRTKKYNAARLKATELNNDIIDRVELYQYLQFAGYNWNGKSGTWSKDNPRAGSVFEDHRGNATGSIKIRLMAHPDELPDMINDICDALLSYGYRVYQTSNETYQNRKGVGHRAYLEGERINE